MRVRLLNISFSRRLAAAVLGLLLILPQALLSLTEMEPNNQIEQAQALQVGENVQGYFQVKGDRDWYRLGIVGPERRIIRIDLTGVPDVDALLEVFDPAGRKLTGSDVGGEGEVEAVINLGVTQGDYYIRVSSRQMSPLIEYNLRTLSIGPWQSGMEFEPNDLAPAAGDMAPGRIMRGYAYPSDDTDWYKIKIDGQGMQLLRIFLSAVPGVDARIEIYDRTGEQLMLSHNGEGPGAPEAVIDLGVPAGEYYIRICSPPDAFNANFEYTLVAEVAGPPQPDQALEPNNDRAQAAELIPDRPVHGYAYPGGDADWYAFTVPDPGMDMLSVELSGLPGVNTRLELMAVDGSLLQRADHLGEGEGERLDRMQVPPGQYYLVVSGHGANDETAYRLVAGPQAFQPATDEDIRGALERALDFLAQGQNPDGSFPGPEGRSPDIAGLGLMAFLGAGCVERDEADRIGRSVTYLKTAYHPGAGDNAASTGGDTGFSHAIAVLALTGARARLDDPGLEPVIEEALGRILRRQNTEEKKPGLPVTAWQLPALRAGLIAGFPLPDSAFEKAAAFIRACFHDGEGAFRETPDQADPNFAATAAGVLSLQMCGQSDDVRIPPALRFLHSHPPILTRASPGSGGTFYDGFNAARAMRYRGGEDWRLWKIRLCRFLADHQNADGSWTHPQADTFETTALGALMLALCCGREPAYMRRLGTLAVVTRDEAGGPVMMTEVPEAIELILDASNSMWRRVAGRWKIEIAREALFAMILSLPGDIQVGLRAYGHRSSYRWRNCEDTALIVPVGPVDRKLLKKKIRGILPRGVTPIAYALQEAAEDFQGIGGEKVIILLCDGRDSCGDDPAAAAEGLARSGLNIKIHVIGFDIRSGETRGQLKAIAAAAGGRYFETAGAEALEAALSEAVAVAVPLTYTLYDENGREIQAGPADAAPLRLTTGTYRIVLDTDPPVEIDGIVIEADRETCVAVTETPEGFSARIE
jgi:hypothetical protein